MKVLYVFGMLVLLAIPAIIGIYMMYNRDIVCVTAMEGEVVDNGVGIQNIEICIDKPADLVVYKVPFSINTQAIEAINPEEAGLAMKAIYLGLCRVIESGEKIEQTSIANVVEPLDNKTRDTIMSMYDDPEHVVRVIVRVEVNGEDWECTDSLREGLKESTPKPREFMVSIQ